MPLLEQRKCCLSSSNVIPKNCDHICKRLADIEIENNAKLELDFVVGHTLLKTASCSTKFSYNVKNLQWHETDQLTKGLSIALL